MKTKSILVDYDVFDYDVLCSDVLIDQNGNQWLVNQIVQTTEGDKLDLHLLSRESYLYKHDPLLLDGVIELPDWSNTSDDD